MTTNSFVSYMILSKFKFGIYDKINSFVIVLGGSEKDHIFGYLKRMVLGLWLCMEWQE